MMTKRTKKIKKIIEDMEPLKIQGIDETEAKRISAWMTELVKNVYEQGYKDGMNHE